MGIGKLIKKLRSERGITQTELAKYAEISFATINKIENEKGGVKFETLNKVLDVLGYELVGRKKISDAEKNKNTELNIR